MLVLSNVTHSLKCYKCMQIGASSSVGAEYCDDRFDASGAVSEICASESNVCFKKTYQAQGIQYGEHHLYLPFLTLRVRLLQLPYLMRDMHLRFFRNTLLHQLHMLSLSKNFPNLDFLCCFCQSHSIALFSGLQILAPFTFAKPRISVLSPTESQHT